MSDHPLLSRLAMNLRALRTQRGITREELAATAHVDTQTVKRIEHARANPALVVLSRLTAALAISLSLVLSADLAADVVLAVPAEEAQPFESDTVGSTIESLRKNRGLSRRGLALGAHLQTLTLSRYEEAATDARLLAAEPIAQALGLELPALVREIELRQHQSALSRAGWHTLETGVRRRMIANDVQSRLWEWRIAPAVAFEGERMIDVAEEIVTAIRGEVRVQSGEVTRRLRRGAAMTLTNGPRKLINTGTSTARVLLFEVTK